MPPRGGETSPQASDAYDGRVRIGAHVSSSGGISNAIGRGAAIGCESLQVFTHNPRTWRPIRHSDEEIAAFRAGAAESGIAPIVSHGL